MGDSHRSSGINSQVKLIRSPLWIGLLSLAAVMVAMLPSRASALTTVGMASATPNTPGLAARYSIAFATTAALTANVDTITITFPTLANSPGATSGVELPSGIAKTMVGIIGTQTGAGGVVSSGHPSVDAAVNAQAGTVTVTVPDMAPGARAANHDLAAGVVMVTFSEEAGITNPIAAGTYRIKVATSQERAGADIHAETFEVPRVLYLSTRAGARNSSLTVKGFGFSNDDPATVWLDRNGNGFLDTGEATLATAQVSNNQFTADVTVDSAFSPGLNTIAARDATGFSLPIGFFLLDSDRTASAKVDAGPNPAKVIVLQGIESKGSCAEANSPSKDTFYARLNTILNAAQSSASTGWEQTALLQDTDVIGFSYSGTYQNCGTNSSFGAPNYPVGTATIAGPRPGAAFVMPWYAKSDTCSGVMPAARQLGILVRRILAVQPNARVYLVGHSMGGMTATYWFSKVATDEERASIQGIVTIDSPLQGYGLWSLVWDVRFYCSADTGAGQDIAGSTPAVPGIMELSRTQHVREVFSIDSTTIGSNIPNSNFWTGGCGGTRFWDLLVNHSCAFTSAPDLSVIGRVLDSLPTPEFKRVALRIDSLAATPRTAAQGSPAMVSVTVTNTGTVTTTFSVVVSTTLPDGTNNSWTPVSGTTAPGQSTVVTTSGAGTWGMLGPRSFDIRVMDYDNTRYNANNPVSFAEAWFPGYLTVVPASVSASIGAITSVPSPPVQGLPGTLSVNITNTGNIGGTFSITMLDRLPNGSVTTFDTAKTLAIGQTQAVSFSTTWGDPGPRDLRVTAATSSGTIVADSGWRTGAVTVVSQMMEVSIGALTSMPSPPVQNRTGVLTVNATNTGNVAGTFTVTISVRLPSGTVAVFGNPTSVALAPGQTKAVAFSSTWGDLGLRDLRVTVKNGAGATVADSGWSLSAVTVVPQVVIVTIGAPTTVPAPPVQGTEGALVVNVTNTGNVSATFLVRVSERFADGTILDITHVRVVLEPGQEEAVSFPATWGLPGPRDVRIIVTDSAERILADSDWLVGAIVVVPPAAGISVGTLTSMPSPPVENLSGTLTVNVTNTGNVPGVFTVTISDRLPTGVIAVFGRQNTVNLGPGQTQAVVVANTWGAPGPRDLRITVTNSAGATLSDSGWLVNAVTVVPQAVSVSIGMLAATPSSPTSGSSGAVSVSVRNSGNIDSILSITVSERLQNGALAGVVGLKETLTLAPGQNQLASFNVSWGAPGSRDARVSVADATNTVLADSGWISAYVTIAAPALGGSIGAITSTPRVPSPGAAGILSLDVANTSTAPATFNVTVLERHPTGSVTTFGSAAWLSLAPGQIETLAFYSTWGEPGPRDLRAIVATSANAIVADSGWVPHAVTIIGPPVSYLITPTPMAATGSLQANQSVTITVLAKDAADNTVPNAQVFLSLGQASGGGSAKVGVTPLTNIPAAFTADSNGVINVIYTAPSVLPKGGTDTLTVQNATASPTIIARATYTYAPGRCGDLTGDGKVDILDVILELQIAVGATIPTAAQLVVGDVARVGVIDVRGAVRLLQHIVGINPVNGCGP